MRWQSWLEQNGVQDAAVVEASSGCSERVCLELNDTWFDIVGLRPAGLLVRNLRWVVAVQVVGRLTLAGRVFALVLITHTSATGHLAIALALPLPA
jgi:hypothetical protein